MAHVTTDVTMDELNKTVFSHRKSLISEGGRTKSSSASFRLKTRAVPSVGQEYRIIKDALRHAGRDGEGTEGMRFKFLWSRMQLEHHFKQAVASRSDKVAMQLYNELIEYSARHTYKIGEGIYSEPEIAGKGENAARAKTDLETLRAARARGATLFTQPTASATRATIDEALGGRQPATIDLGALSPSEQAKALKRVGQIDRAARSGEIDTYSEDSIESLRDSESDAVGAFFRGRETMRAHNAWRVFKGARGGRRT